MTLSYLPVLGQVDLEHFCIVFESQRLHCPQDILAVDRFTLLELAPITCYELR